MEIHDWRATAGLNEVYREIRGLGLEPAIAELETFGFTVLEGVLVERERTELAEALVDIAEQAVGSPIDRERGCRLDGTPVHKWFPMLLTRGDLFRRLILHPVSEALVTYLLGASATVSSVTAFVRGPGDSGRELHCDDESPNPLPRYAQVANLHWILSPYTRENGAMSIVPGSHRLCRMPVPGEGDDLAIPVETPPGSIILFHGNTWHGAFPRTAPGLRLTIAAYFNRGTYRWQNENYLDALGADVLAQYPERFSRWLGSRIPWHWASVEERMERRQLVDEVARTSHRQEG